jgi:hypothetical protein
MSLLDQYLDQQNKNVPLIVKWLGWVVRCHPC